MTSLTGKRMAIGAVVAGAALVGLAGPAFADPYGTVLPTTIAPSTTAAPPQINVDDNTVTAGQVVTVTSQGHQPGSTVTFYLFSDPVLLGTAIANSAGVATLTVAMPAGLTGTHTIQSVGVNASGAPLVQTQQVVFSSGGLPATGSDVVGLVAIGGVVLAGGAALVFVSRRRRPVAA